MAYTTIDDPTIYFNTKLYTGDNSVRNITGVGFQPDWVWIKDRDSGANHCTFDVIRGATKLLRPNQTNSESTEASTLSAFISDGFTLNGSDSFTNDNTNKYVAWNWKAGGSASSNSDGSITSTVSANTTAGFSIATYTGTGSGATVGHGLGTTPAWVLVKERGASGESWNNFHQSLGGGKTIMLNLTNAEQSSSTIWNNTAPTSSVFSVGADAGSNGSSKTYVAYCFAEKKGYSKFGSYRGINNADGPFVFLGFKPAFVMIKDSSASNSWHIRDNKRSNFNPSVNFLVPNSSNAEVTAGEKIDLLSNGFKIKQTGGKLNDSGNAYIYMAFAENPFVTAGTKAAGTAR